MSACEPRNPSAQKSTLPQCPAHLYLARPTFQSIGFDKPFPSTQSQIPSTLHRRLTESLYVHICNCTSILPSIHSSFQTCFHPISRVFFLLGTNNFNSRHLPTTQLQSPQTLFPSHPSRPRHQSEYPSRHYDGPVRCLSGLLWRWTTG